MTSAAAGRVGMIVNPAAGLVARRYLRRAPFWQRYVAEPLVRITANLAELETAIVALRAAHVDVIAVLGGDGSIHHVADALLRDAPAATVPMLLPLGGGTMNGVARALGTRGPPERVLQRALASLATGKAVVHAQPLLRVSDARERRTYHGFSFATGLVYRAFARYYQSRAPRLIAAVAASLLPVTAAIRGGSFYTGVRLDVRADGDAWLAQAHTLVASVLENPLLWFRPFGSVAADHATFNLGATSLRPMEIASRLWAIFRGRCRHPRLRIGQVHEAAIEADGVGYLIDGDLYPAAGGVSVRLSAGLPLRILAAPA